MSVAEIGLALGILSGGLFAGLMLMLVVVLDPMWGALPADEYVRAMRAFLPAAKGDPVITLVTLAQFLGPVPALVEAVALGDAARAVLLGTGVLLAFAPLVVTVRANFPVYAAMLGWPDVPPPGWRAVRARFRALNAVRFALAAAATGAYLVAALA